MELDELKDMKLERNSVVEYTLDYTSEFGKGTRLGYFDELHEEEVPDWLKGSVPEPPYVSIMDYKDKNGCPRDVRNIPLEDILYIWDMGKSNLMW